MKISPDGVHSDVLADNLPLVPALVLMLSNLKSSQTWGSVNIQQAAAEMASFTRHGVCNRWTGPVRMYSPELPP